MSLNSLTLADLPRLGRARVAGVVGDDAVAARLRELGFSTGTEVGFVRAAPLGDPFCFRLRGVEICLRRREALRVLVVPDGEAALAAAAGGHA